MQQTPDEKIVERIRALLALSKSTNEHEASLAAAKAQELLLKYNLEVSQIPGQFARESVQRFNWYREGPFWQDTLLNSLCMFNFCRVIRNTASRWKRAVQDGWGYAVFGTPTNVKIVEYMFDYLVDTIYDITPYSDRSYNENFRKGCVAAIYVRLRDEYNEFAKSTAQTRALVVTNEAALAPIVKEHFPNTATSRMSVSDARAYNDGVKAGENIPLRKGVETSTANQHLLS